MRSKYFEEEENLMDVCVQGEEPGEHGGKHPQHRGVAQPRQVKDEQVRPSFIHFPPHGAVIICPVCPILSNFNAPMTYMAINALRGPK